jgi:hypothetical protein
MKKRTGTIQVVISKTENVKEMNVTYPFKGLLSLLKQVWLAYKRGADKIYIFPHKKVV